MSCPVARKVTRSPPLLHSRAKAALANQVFADANSVKSLDSIPSVGRLFMFTAGDALVDKLMDAGAKNPRMFRMWLGPRPMVVATHPDLARQILTRPDDFIKGSDPFRNAKSITDILTKDKTGRISTMVNNNGKEWAALRKPLDPAFTKDALRVVVPEFCRASQKVVDQWSSTDGLVDAKRDMSRFAIDVLGAAVLGRSFGALDGTFDRTYSHYQNVMSELMNPLYLVFPSLERLPLSRNRKFLASCAHLQDVLQSAMKERIAERKQRLDHGLEETKAKNMLDLLLDRADGVIAEDQLLPLLFAFFIAGHDTTATSLTWAMHFLGKYPEMQARARQEALSVLNGAEDPTPEMLEEVPFISAFINEGLRLRPPVYNLFTRQASQDTELDGVLIPKGTAVSIHIGAVNTHPDAYDSPEEFNPERFLKKKGEKGKKPRIWNNLPFSAGPRRCLGDKFSLLEQKTLLIKLLSKCEVLPVDQSATASYANDGLALAFLLPEEMQVRVRPSTA